MRCQHATNKELTPESALADAVESLVAEIQILRMAVDELREEVQWNNQNQGDLSSSRRFRGPHRRVTSCSLDPTNPDFAVNPVPEETLAKLRADLPPLSHGSQRELFG